MKKTIETTIFCNDKIYLYQYYYTNRECPKRVVLKIIFISVCYQENEVFLLKFCPAFFKKRVRV